ncbi:MAG: MarR family winged helix-turn-helix transcriptional regulator [Candidatus Binataceae bacterium]
MKTDSDKEMNGAGPARGERGGIKRRADERTRAKPPSGAAPGKAARRAIDSSPLTELLGYQVRRAELAIFQNFAQAMSRHKLSPGQIGALLLIERNPGLTQSELAMALGIDRSSAVPLLDRLERRGAVARGRGERDRRSHALALTPQGRALLKAARARLYFHEAAIASGLSPAEVKTLRTLLSRITQ